MKHVWRVSYFDKSFMFFRTNTNNIVDLFDNLRSFTDIECVKYIPPSSMHYNDVMTQVVPSHAV